MHFTQAGPEKAEIIGNVVASRARPAAFGVAEPELIPELMCGGLPGHRSWSKWTARPRRGARSSTP